MPRHLHDGAVSLDGDDTWVTHRLSAAAILAAGLEALDHPLCHRSPFKLPLGDKDDVLREDYEAVAVLLDNLLTATRVGCRPSGDAAPRKANA